jgi:methionyl-tRNA formyltransferase
VTYKPRIILFGTPEFAAISFRALIETGLYDIPLIVTQPDRAVGRGLEITNSPVKSLALEKEIPLLQPKSLKGKTSESQDFIEVLSSLSPIDLFIVIAYGKIIPKALLEIPQICALNIHGSILPRWRGAAPIHRALAAGDKTTGVGIMRLEEGLDTGPVFSESITNIYPEDDFLTLHDRLAVLGKDLLLETIPKILSKTLTPREQNSEGVNYANKWEKADLEISWTDAPETTLNRIRASAPFPGARTKLNGNLVKVFKASGTSPHSSGLPAGTIVEITGEGAVVQLADEQRIVVKEIQLPGKKRLPIVEIARGRGIKVGDRFE